jgi:ABC-type multidrug transport system ATPase subunit
MDAQQRQKRVDQLIYLLGLQDCQFTPCGGNYVTGLSGGERKRTSIGYDLITLPKLILLDEPTSGLDSNCAFNLI